MEKKIRCPVCYNVVSITSAHTVCPYCGYDIYDPSLIRDGDRMTWEEFNRAIGAGAPCADCPIRSEIVIVHRDQFGRLTFEFRGKVFHPFDDILTTCEMLQKHFDICNKQLTPSEEPDALQGGTGFGAD